MDAHELSLAGIDIGDTETMVLRKLGMPGHMVDAGKYLVVRMDYPGLTVWLDE